MVSPVDTVNPSPQSMWRANWGTIRTALAFECWESCPSCRRNAKRLSQRCLADLTRWRISSPNLSRTCGKMLGSQSCCPTFGATAPSKSLQNGGHTCFLKTIKHFAHLPNMAELGCDKFGQYRLIFTQGWLVDPKTWFSPVDNPYFRRRT